MTKRIREAEALGVRVNETDLAILREIARKSGAAKRPVATTVKDLCGVTERCEVSVRLSVRNLDERGLLNVFHRHLSNGGQIENEYSLTDFGYTIIEATGGVPK